MNNSRKQKILHPSTIISNTEIRKNVHYLQFEKKQQFLPGQVVAIAVEPNDEPRLYSIASGKDEQTMAILFDINPSGQLTPLLSKLNEGDQLYVSDPFGKFLCQNTPAMWIATGTGIAPFISVLKSGKQNNITLLHGSRTLDAFFFDDFFKEELKEHYKRFCTTEAAQGVINGRLTQYLKDQESLPPNFMYYLCGSSQMVIDVREILIDKGVPFDHIIAEIYF